MLVAWCYHAVVAGPTYSLAEVRRLIDEKNYWITTSAMDGAFDLGFDDVDIIECIRDYLDESNFYKTMPAAKQAGLMQDVYRVAFKLVPIYVKLQISADQKAVVISFKQDDQEWF
jgi:hypothetical protein